jgi:hypothetical protein
MQREVGWRQQGGLARQIYAAQLPGFKQNGFGMKVLQAFQ